MKALIVSDTHGYDKNLVKLIKQMGALDAVIHCGDGEGHEGYFAQLVDCPLYMVRGNNDFFSELEREIEFELWGYKILLTHGHYYGVSMGPEHIMEEGRARGVDIVMYGHTHRPELLREKDITVLNPGSISYPRQEGRKPTYIVMETDQKNNLYFCINYC
ncbi:MAG: metallophosphoesterase [Lachnospiraceae bacterium]|nr:metallophosphoesterase [Lachnospiraceae bacterium]